MSNMLRTDFIPPVCNSNIWQHIQGWEVVAALFFITITWSMTNIARMYFMVKAVEAGIHKAVKDVKEKQKVADDGP